MTQSALDQYALANGYGKTTAQMTEAEKVSLRYAFVQQQLSAASGDFARTSGSWANQVRVLKLQIDSLKASIGQGLINLFTPIIQTVNNLLGKLVTLANAFKAFTELITGKKNSGSSGGGSAQIAAAGTAATDASTGLQNAADAANDTTSAVKKTGNAAQKAAKQMRSLMGFDKITKISEPSESSSGGTGDSGSTPKGSGVSGGSLRSPVDFGSLSTGEDAVSKLGKKWKKVFEDMKKAIEPTTKALKNLWNNGLARLGKFGWTALKDFWQHFLVPVGKWTMGTGLPRFINALNDGLMKVNFGKINKALAKLWDSLAKFTVNVGDGLLWIWEKILVPLGTWTANEVVPRFLETLKLGIDALNNILTALKPLFQWFWDSVLQPLAQWTGGIFLSVWDGINGALKKFSDWCANNPQTIQNIAVIIGSFFAAWKIASFVQQAAGFITTAFNIVTSVKSVAGAVSLLKTGVGTLTTALGGPLVIGIAAAIAAGVLLYKNWDTVCKWATKLKDWVVDKTRGLRDGAVNAFNTLTTNCSNAIHALYTSVTSKWNAIKEKFNTFRNWLASVFQTDWSIRFGVLGNILNAFLRSVKTKVDSIQKVFKGLITFISGVFKGNWQQAWEGIKQIFAGVFQGLSDLARTPVNAIIAGFNGVLGTVNGLINKINGISFKIEIPKWIPGIGGSWWGFNGFSIPSIGSIPFLAQGGYVKPNTPQLAMIGDNRHQGEVVAPEGKLLEMARAAAELSGGDSAKTEKLLQELIELIKNLPVVELDPEAIRKYFIKKTNQNTKATGKPELLY
jgi:phage-related protein